MSIYDSTLQNVFPALIDCERLVDMLTLAALHTSPFEVWGRPQKGALTVYQQPVEGLDGVEVIVSDDVSGIPSKRMCGGSPFSTASELSSIYDGVMNRV